MTIKFQVAKDQRRGKWFEVQMNGGVASCSCGKSTSNTPCVHIAAIRSGEYLTK